MFPRVGNPSAQQAANDEEGSVDFFFRLSAEIAFSRDFKSSSGKPSYQGRNFRRDDHVSSETRICTLSENTFYTLGEMRCIRTTPHLG